MLNANEKDKDTKRRKRAKGSCERCKRRKIRCNVECVPETRCSNCVSSNSDCIVSVSVQSIVGHQPDSEPPQGSLIMTPQEHVAALVSHAASSYIPDADLRRVLLDVARYARSLDEERRANNAEASAFPRVPGPSGAAPSSAKDSQPEDSEAQLDMFAILEAPLMSARFARIKLHPADAVPYFGKTSHLELMNAAMEARDGFDSTEGSPRPPTDIIAAIKAKRFWRSSPWEDEEHSASMDVKPPLAFPAPDLLQHLVAVYFTRVNPLAFLLHQPTFERAVADGLHLIDHSFGCTLLAVCALAAKCTDDARVVRPGADMDTEVSAGWVYFSQIKPFVKARHKLITMYQAQTICLSILYDNKMMGSSRDGSWALVGAALRYVQEVGAHRRNRFTNKHVSEAWKRVFWQLICIDTLASASTTRPLAMSAFDYDADYPAECDDADEWWDSPDLALPSERASSQPSLASYTIAYLKLFEILGMAQRTLYLVKESDKPEGWPQSAVAAIDSALNAWIDEVPAHLRWDPHMDNPTFAAQSAVLYARYYGVQIHTHRIFIPSSTNKIKIEPSLYAYPSLAICASSARACSHVMNAFVGREVLYYPYALTAVFDSCLVLLLHVWRGRRGALSADRLKCLQDAFMCLKVFRFWETRWQIAGFYHDAITELMGATHLDWPTEKPANPRKREVASIAGPSSVDSSDAHELRTDAAEDHAGIFAHDHDENDPFSLPVHTYDLGRMPVYEPFNWGIDPFEASSLLLGTSDDSLDGSSAYPHGGITDHWSWNNHDWSNSLTSVDELISLLDNSHKLVE